VDQALVPSDLAALSIKLDNLTAQVAYLAEQARLAERRQQERAELMHDVVPIAHDAIGLSDLLRLLKRLLRNGRNLDRMLDQLESLMDLAQTVGPLSDSIFEKATDVLQAAEHRGYFALAGGAARAVDKVATSLTPEDIDRSAESLVVLAGVFKELDQPVDPSMRSLMRQMRNPDVRRGLAKVMRMLGAFGSETTTV
jgi:uncharacterized protein YjgD (DUF1641 family)